MSSEGCLNSRRSISSMIEDYMPGQEKGYARGPVRALMSALLFDGIQSYFNYLYARSESQRARYREAYNWVESKEHEYIFAFESVCDALGVNADFFRCGLLQVEEKAAANDDWKKTRRNF